MVRWREVGLRGVKVARQWRRPDRPLALAFVAVLFATCSSGGSGAPANVCTPGIAIACTCTNATSGAQTCTADGLGYGACMCTGTGAGGGPGDVGGTLGGLGGAPTGGPTGGDAGSHPVGASGGIAGTTVGGIGGVITGGGAPGTGGRPSGTGGTVAASGGAGGHIGAVDGGRSGGMGTSTGGAAGYTGRFATVLLEDALIGPAKVNGDPWDEGNPIPPQVFTDLNGALETANPFQAALAVLGEKLLTDALTATEKPDIVATMRLDVAGQIGSEQALVAPAERSEDSYTPVFPGPRGYSKVPIDADVRLHVFLKDYDLILDDDVGTAVINSADMQAALALRKKYEVPVWDQTSKQILFIGISVQ